MDLRDVLENQSDLPPGLKSYANVQRSYGDISTKAIWDDVTYMIFGYSVLYIFVQIMMGRFNRVEQRVSLVMKSGSKSRVRVGSGFQSSGFFRVRVITLGF